MIANRHSHCLQIKRKLLLIKKKNSIYKVLDDLAVCLLWSPLLYWRSATALARASRGHCGVERQNPSFGSTRPRRSYLSYTQTVFYWLHFILVLRIPRYTHADTHKHTHTLSLSLALCLTHINTHTQTEEVDYLSEPETPLIVSSLSILTYSKCPGLNLIGVTAMHPDHRLRESLIHM